MAPGYGKLPPSSQIERRQVLFRVLAKQVNTESLVTSGRRTLFCSWTESGRSTENRDQSKEVAAEAESRCGASLKCPYLGLEAQCQAERRLPSPAVCKASADLASQARQQECVPWHLLLSEMGLGRAHP